MFFLDFPTVADQEYYYTTYRDENGAFETTWTDSGGVERGRYLEFFDSTGAAVIYFTFDEEVMAVWVQRADGNGEAAREWFVNADLFPRQ